MDTRDQTLTKLTRLHDKSHPTHHRPVSLRWNYSRTAVSIMKLVMEDGWWWRRRRFPLSGAQNGPQICPPEEEQEVVAAPYCKTRWTLLLDFYLHGCEYIELESRSEEPRGAHKPPGRALGGAPSWLVANRWTPLAWFFRQYFLLIPKIFSVNFQPIPRTFISAQKTTPW